MKILLFGKSGQVGWELQRSLAPQGELVVLYFDSTDHCGDYSNLGGLAVTVRAAVIETTHDPVPVHAPPQPPNVEPVKGVATSVIVAL